MARMEYGLLRDDDGDDNDDDAEADDGNSEKDDGKLDSSAAGMCTVDATDCAGDGEVEEVQEEEKDTDQASANRFRGTRELHALGCHHPIISQVPIHTAHPPVLGISQRWTSCGTRFAQSRNLHHG